MLVEANGYEGRYSLWINGEKEIDLLKVDQIGRFSILSLTPSLNQEDMRKYGVMCTDNVFLTLNDSVEGYGDSEDDKEFQLKVYAISPMLFRREGWWLDARFYT